MGEKDIIKAVFIVLLKWFAGCVVIGCISGKPALVSLLLCVWWGWHIGKELNKIL